MLEGNKRIHHRRKLQLTLLYWLCTQSTSTFFAEKENHVLSAGSGVPRFRCAPISSGPGSMLIYRATNQPYRVGKAVAIRNISPSRYPDGMNR